MTFTQGHLRTLALVLSALALYIPANLYPVMTMQYMGLYSDSTIWDGVKSLYQTNMWFTGTVVFLASIMIPLFKLLGLLFVTMCASGGYLKTASSTLLKFIDFIGRWSMLDVFLLALMVALIKFGSFATVTASTGSYLFAAVVVLTMLASATFDTSSLKSITEKEPQNG